MTIHLYNKSYFSSPPLRFLEIYIFIFSDICVLSAVPIFCFCKSLKTLSVWKAKINYYISKILYRNKRWSTFSLCNCDGQHIMRLQMFHHKAWYQTNFVAWRKLLQSFLDTSILQNAARPTMAYVMAGKINQVNGFLNQTLVKNMHRLSHHFDWRWGVFSQFWANKKPR